MKQINYIFTMLLFSLSASAYEFKSDGIYYNITSSSELTVEVTSGGNQYSGSVTIPSSVTDNGIKYSVTSIGDNAFKDCSSLASINIPSSVTSIGKYAFEHCSSLTSVNIPSSVTSIGYSAFFYCSSLTSINIPSSVTNIDNYVFGLCSSLANLNIPSSVTSIGFFAFSGCSSLTSIKVEQGNTVYDSRDNCNAVIKTSSNTLIRGCSTTVIPNSVTSIGAGAFEYCSGLTSINIPSSVTSIGFSAFKDCSSLKSVNIPSSVTSIGNSAFWGCSSLTRINIPSSVTSIGLRTFSGCSSLTSINIPSSITSIGMFAFSDCSILTNISIPSSVTSIGMFAFSSCSSLTNISIPSSVTSIGLSAFKDCSNIKSIKVAQDNTVYDSRENCNAIIESSSNALIFGCYITVIPSSVTSIGFAAFEYCSGITSIKIPTSVTSIGRVAFSYCPNLTSITCDAITPPSVDYNTFYNTDVSKALLYVPDTAVETYKVTEYWQDFIVKAKSSDPSGVDGVSVKKEFSGKVSVYNIAGKSVKTIEGVNSVNGIMSGLKAGTYVVKCGGETVKVVKE